MMQIPERAGRSAPVSFEGVSKRFGGVSAVDDLNLAVENGELLVLLGPSGCGKTTSLRMLAGLEKITSGAIRIGDRVVNDLPPRARDIAMVFQSYALYPHMSVYDNMAFGLKLRKTPKAEIDQRVKQAADMLSIAQYLDRKPKALSGGQRQRVGIARALAMSPKLIVADEPVSALDVSIQAQVLNLFADLQDELGLTYVFIAHDLGVVKHVSDRIAVMYLGTIVEVSDADALYDAPAHPYTEALLSAAPEIDDGEEAPRRERIVLTGDVPNPVDRPTGCPFHTRCPYRQDVCVTARPPLAEVAPGRVVACHFPLVDAGGLPTPQVQTTG